MRKNADAKEERQRKRRRKKRWWGEQEDGDQGGQMESKEKVEKERWKGR
jgi:hypothetical protein